MLGESPTLDDDSITLTYTSAGMKTYRMCFFCSGTTTAMTAMQARPWQTIRQPVQVDCLLF